MSRFQIIALATLFLLTACGSVGKMEPYNTNDAGAMSVLYPKFSGLWNPSADGTVTVNMPDGEVLNGTYSFMRRGNTSFGKLFGRSYVVGGASDPQTVYPGVGGYGVSVMRGDRGSSMRCEFFYDARRTVGGSGGTGYGVCETSARQDYLLTF